MDKLAFVSLILVLGSIVILLPAVLFSRWLNKKEEEELEK